MTSKRTNYMATRLVYDSKHDFVTTRSRFESHVPLLDPAVAVELVLAGASWEQVEEAVETRCGPGGLVGLARVDQGALLSLSREPLEGALYLVGNPLVARQITRHNVASVLYAPFRVAVFRDATGVHVAYDQPSTVFASLGSVAIDEIAAELDGKAAEAAEHACDNR